MTSCKLNSIYENFHLRASPLPRQFHYLILKTSGHQGDWLVGLCSVLAESEPREPRIHDRPFNRFTKASHLSCDLWKKMSWLEMQILSKNMKMLLKMWIGSCDNLGPKGKLFDYTENIIYG